MQLLGPAPGRPNPKWSSTKLWRYVIIQYLMTGKLALLKEYDAAGRVVALWPLMAQHLNPVLSQPRSTDYFEGFRYGTRGTNGYREFKPADIVYCWRPSQEDFRQPEPPMRLAQWGIQVLRLVDEFDRAFLANGGVPAHLVVTPPFDENNSRIAFRDQFRRKFGGPVNSGKVAFAEFTDESGDFGQGQGGVRQTVDVKVIGQSQKDSQMDILRDGRINEMCVALGVALSLIGDSNQSKFTNMDNDRKNLWQFTNNPLRIELEDNINTSLSELDGPTDVGWFDVSGVPELRKPPVFTEQGGMAAVAAGIISPNAYLIDRGLPPNADPDMDIAKVRAGTIRDTVSTSLPAPGLPGTEPPADVVPTVKNELKTPAMKRVQAVRTDLLEVVRGQLANELAAQRHELEQRRDGKRGGRRRAHAQVDLSLVYDDAYWQQRMVTNLSPGLRAAGYDDDAIAGFSVDVTAAVRDQLDQTTDVDATAWDPDGYMLSLVSRPAPAQLVESGTVETALLQLAGGHGDAASALAMLGGSS
jgi:hypothetical protein